MDVKPLGPDTWPDFEAMVERHPGMFSGCWCCKFHEGRPDEWLEGESNKDFKRRLVMDGVARAALVYEGDDAVAWAEYGTPEELPGLHHNKQYLAETERLPDFRITCIKVMKPYRRRGLARTALDGAVDLIARAGGGVVEGYPQDPPTTTRQQDQPSLLTTAPAAVRGAGFTYVRPWAATLRRGAGGRTDQLIIRRATERCRAAIRVAYSSGVTGEKCGRWSRTAANGTTATRGPSSGPRSRSSRCQRSIIAPVRWPVVSSQLAMPGSCSQTTNRITPSGSVTACALVSEVWWVS